MIHIQNLSKSFRVHKKNPGFAASLKSLFHREWIEKYALKNVSLDIGPGEILGLVGANGAGKTTLVKILAGILHPSAGEATVLGFKPAERDDLFRKQISLIMGQKAQLWWDLPAADGFELLREIYEIDTQEYKTRLSQLIETLGVQNQLNIQVRRLSLGERMKMELIAALLHQPKVIFLDEPTIGLDISAQRAIRKFIADYQREHAPAMILTSHYMEDIEHLCKRIVVMKDGEIVYNGELETIRRNHIKHRLLTLTLSDAVDPTTLQIKDAELVQSELPIVRYRVGIDSVAKAASWAMSHLPVIDIRVEEEDISTVIESIMRRGLA